MKKLLIIILSIFSLQVLADDNYKIVFAPITINLVDNEQEITSNFHLDFVVFDDKKKCRNYILDAQETNIALKNTSFKKFVSGSDGLFFHVNGLSSYVFCQSLWLHKKTLGIRK